MNTPMVYIVSLIAFASGVLTGINIESIERKGIKTKAIAYNCAYYHPDTGKFTWGNWRREMENETEH